MKIKTKFLISAAALCVAFTCLFCVLPLSKTIYAADNLTTSQRKTYEDYINYELPPLAPSPEFYEYSYNNIDNIALLIGTDANGQYYGITGFLALYGNKLTVGAGSETEQLINKRQEAIDLFDAMIERKRTIATIEIVSYYERVTLFFDYDNDLDDDDLAQLTTLLEEYQTAFLDDEVKMTYINYTAQRFTEPAWYDSPYSSFSPQSLLKTAVDYAQKCVDKIEVGKTYATTLKMFQDEVAALTPVEQTKKEDKDMLIELRNKISDYYEKAKLHAVALGIDEEQCEENFEYLIWQVNRRLAKINPGVSGDFWLIFLILLICGVGYMFSTGVWKLRRPRRKVKDEK